MVQADDLVPSFNRFVQAVVAKGETTSYADCTGALAAVSTVSDKSGAKDSVEKLLTRLTQYGYLRISTVEPLLKAINGSASNDTLPIYTRLLFYLAQLALGNGSAGTPLPMPTSRGSLSLPKAVDLFGPEVLSAAWADLSDEKSPFMRKQGAMRVLAALAQAALASKPDDPTYPAGVFVTLQSLLERIDQLQASRKSLAAVLAAQTAAAGGAAAKKKNLLSDFKKQMETWSLLRLAFSSARVALSRSGQVQIAQRSFNGVCSSDAVCARHSLALASLIAKEPGGAIVYVQNIGPALQNNVELSRRLETGMLFTGAGAAVGKGSKAGAPPPTVMREDSTTYLNLKDVFARVYLARGCAAALQGAAGDQSSSILWQALVMLATADQSDLVALEAIKAMFGAPYPHAEPLRKRITALSEAELQEISLHGRVYAGCWQMAMGSADATLPVPEDSLPPVHEALQPAQATSRMSTEVGAPPKLQPMSSYEPTPGSGNSVFGRIVSRIMFALQSRSASLIAAGAKAAAVLLESRAWYASMSGGAAIETDGVRRCVRVLQGMLMAVFSSEALSAVERCAAAEALVWLQLTAPDDARLSTVPPVVLLKAASQGGLGVQSVVKSLFADPWPESLAAGLLMALIRRMRCNTALSGWCCELAGAVAAATPAAIAKDILMSVWDAAPGHVGLGAAVDLLGSPVPPITQPASAAPVEIKAFAAMQEAAYENLRSAAAWWIGEHANALAGVADWKPVTKASVSVEDMLPKGVTVSQLEIGERLLLAATAYAPLLVMATTHLQRHMLAGSWEVRIACVQAIAKIAVRSPEPFRIQAYSVLRGALASAGTAPNGKPSDLSSWLDPLGLAPSILPVLEVLDAIYAGQQVLATHCNMYGLTAKEWPAGALSSVRRRHEWLLGVIAQRIGGVPPTFYPLGRKSRALLNPDEKLEEEEVEADEDEAALDAAAAAAAGEGHADDVQYDEYGNPYVDDQYYDGYEEGADPLAKWQAGKYGENGASESFARVATFNWNGYDDQANHYDNGYDEDDIRHGTVLYTFTAGSEDEVSVTQGERIRVHVDMGDWLHVTNAAGQQGIVPASYVQVEEVGDGGEAIGMSPRSTTDGRNKNQYYNPAVGADGGYDMYNDSYNPYGMYDGGQADYGLYNQEGEEDGSYRKSAGGFDDFGTLLVQAAEARAVAAQKASDKATAQKQQQQEQQQVLNRNVSMSSANSSFSARQAPSSLQETTSVNSSVGLTTTYSMQSSVAPNAETPRLDMQSSYTPPAAAYGYGAFEDQQGIQQGIQEDVALQPQEAFQASSAADYAQETTAEITAGSRVQVEFDFAAEAAEELTVNAGDQLEVTSVVDGWIMAYRASDGRSGLVPANYVSQLP